VIHWRSAAAGNGGSAAATQHTEGPAHDALSAIRAVDHIIVLHDGDAVQHGTHDELMAQEGPYRKIWEALVRHSLETRRDARESSEVPPADSPEVRPSKFAVALERANGDGPWSAGREFTLDRGSAPLQLSKIRSSDRVLVFAGKDPVQFGRHDELMVNEGPYRELLEALSRSRMERQ
jgi:hypothetical protein